MCTRRFYRIEGSASERAWVDWLLGVAQVLRIAAMSALPCAWAGWDGQCVAGVHVLQGSASGKPVPVSKSLTALPPPISAFALCAACLNVVTTASVVQHHINSHGTSVLYCYTRYSDVLGFSQCHVPYFRGVQLTNMCMMWLPNAFHTSVYSSVLRCVEANFAHVITAAAGGWPATVC